MPRKLRHTVRISANVPKEIIEQWEALQRQSNDYLPLLNRSQRIELAILEHIQLLKQRLGITPGGGGGGMKARPHDADTEEDGGENSPHERWHSGESEAQDYLRTG